MTGRQLQYALDRLRISQAEAARRLGVAQATLFRWRHGHRKIPGPVVEAVRCWFREQGLEVPKYLEHKSEKQSKK